MSQRKKTAIKQGALMDVMLHLADLPKREKDPGALLGLSEIFRTKEYAAEIRGALKKGYTFDQLAEIFSERCGVEISGRQLKHHNTLEQNLRAKSKKTRETSVVQDETAQTETQPANVDENGETVTDCASNLSVQSSPESTAERPPTAPEDIQTEAANAMPFAFERHPFAP